MSRTTNLLMSLPLLLAVAVGVLSGGSAHAMIANSTTAVMVAAAALIFGYGLFQRLALNGPNAEMWATFLTAAGLAAPAIRAAAGVPLDSVLGMTLSLGGAAVFIAGLTLYIRVRRGRRPTTG